MTGYSGTPLATKLGIKEGTRLTLLDAPAGWSVPALPSGVEVRTTAGPCDVVVAFCRTARDVRSRLPSTGRHVFPSGGLWVAWPRKAGGHVSDVTEQLLRDLGLPSGLVDNKVAAIDERWSGLQFVLRVELRSATR